MPHLQSEGFSAGTLIKTPTGYKPIENIQINDAVLCDDLNGGSAYGTVVGLQQELADAYAIIFFSNNRCLKIAHDQLLYVKDKQQWINVDNLIPGDALLNYSTERVTIEKILHVHENLKLYTVEVLPFHNFYASESELLAHNFAAALVPALPVLVTSGKISAFTTAIMGSAAVIGNMISQTKTYRRIMHFLGIKSKYYSPLPRYCPNVPQVTYHVASPDSIPANVQAKTQRIGCGSKVPDFEKLTAPVGCGNTIPIKSNSSPGCGNKAPDDNIKNPLPAYDIAPPSNSALPCGSTIPTNPPTIFAMNEDIDTRTVLVDDSAHSVVQYERLKETLNEEQYTSIIKCTKHGVQRLIERNFKPEEVSLLIKQPDFSKTQEDGAIVLIRRAGDNKYNLIVYNQEKGAVVTALREISKQAIINLGKNYGYHYE